MRANSRNGALPAARLLSHTLTTMGKASILIGHEYLIIPLWIIVFIITNLFVIVTCTAMLRLQCIRRWMIPQEMEMDISFLQAVWLYFKVPATWHIKMLNLASIPSWCWPNVLSIVRVDQDCFFFFLHPTELLWCTTLKQTQHVCFLSSVCRQMSKVFRCTLSEELPH